MPLENGQKLKIHLASKEDVALVRRAAEEVGMSPEQLAVEMGVNKDHLREQIRGKRVMRVDSLLAIRYVLLMHALNTGQSPSLVA